MKSLKMGTMNKVFIIAEIGNNHEGDLELAKKLIKAAAKSGVDAVKFQTIRPRHLINQEDIIRYNQLKKFELSFNDYQILNEVAQNEGVEFMSTPFDLESASFLNNYVSVFKIASGDNDFFPLIEKISSFGKPIILSTGMAEIPDIKKTVNFIKENWEKSKIIGEISLLHCVSNYPTNPEDANLTRINLLRMSFPDCTIGYSDHTLGILASISAVALGARIIEKHFTLDKNYSSFRDHALSADPSEMMELVKSIREVEMMIRKSQKIVLNKDRYIVSRRSIAINKNMKKGEILNTENLCWVRPGVGFRPGEENKVLGKMLIKDIKARTILTKSDFKKFKT